MTKFYLTENNKEREVHFDVSFLPMLISGAEGSGTSFFSVSLISSLALQGLPVVFYSLKSQARLLFEEQIGDRKNDKDIVSIESGNTELAQKTFSEFAPNNKHVLFIKNAETVLTKELLAVVEKSDKLILSGDLSRSLLQKYVDEKKFATTIVMDNRKGYLVNKNTQGIIRVENE
ncbi:MAG: hypothetical protein AAB420_04125 [Patescibacteria group bacterium]